jgi:uncharacterized membrane protein
MKQIMTFQKFSLFHAVSILAMIAVLALALAPMAFAQFQTPSPGGTGLPGDSTISGFILRIINIALAVAGLIAVLFLIIGGFRYITAAGNEETAESAKKIILNAVIGIVVIILAFVIVRVISNALVSGQV